MKYLGIDYGDKRIGIAVSDPEGRIAFPRKILLNGPTLMRQLKELVEEEAISKIIVGIPLSADGKDTEQSLKTKKFVELLGKEISTPVEYENELLTSHIVEKAGMKKEHTDDSAAALILQSYLDRLHQ